MSSFTTSLNRTLIGTAIAMGAAFSASAAEKDEYGMNANPYCSNIIENTVTSQQKVLNQQAQSPRWDLAVYVKADTQQWSLLGKSRDGTVPAEKRCLLDAGRGSYHNEKWYTEFFKDPKMAAAAKPEMN